MAFRPAGRAIAIALQTLSLSTFPEERARRPLFAFDLLALNGEDLRRHPLEIRPRNTARQRTPNG